MYRYKITFYPDKGAEDLYTMENGVAREQGLIGAKSYKDAVETVVYVYGGETNVVSIELWECMNPISDDDIMETITEN